MFTFHKRLEKNKAIVFEPIKGSKNISCNYAWVNFFASTKLMAKTSLDCASLVKFLTTFKRGTTHRRFLKVLAKCSKFNIRAWIVGLSQGYQTPFSTIMGNILVTSIEWA
jgi:hypothetical protein